MIPFDVPPFVGNELKYIVVVHYEGVSCEMDSVMSVAERSGRSLVHAIL